MPITVGYPNIKRCMSDFGWSVHINYSEGQYHAALVRGNYIRVVGHGYFITTALRDLDKNALGAQE